MFCTIVTEKNRNATCELVHSRNAQFLNESGNEILCLNSKTLEGDLEKVIGGVVWVIYNLEILYNPRATAILGSGSLVEEIFKRFVIKSSSPFMLAPPPAR